MGYIKLMILMLVRVDKKIIAHDDNTTYIYGGILELSNYEVD